MGNTVRCAPSTGIGYIMFVRAPSVLKRQDRKMNALIEKIHALMQNELNALNAQVNLEKQVKT